MKKRGRSVKRVCRDFESEIGLRDDQFLVFRFNGDPECIYISLHTEKPEEGDWLFDKAPKYEPYAPVAIPRDKEHWELRGDTFYNRKLVTFPQCKSGTDTVQYGCFNLYFEGRWTIFAMFALTASLKIAPGMTAEFSYDTISFFSDGSDAIYFFKKIFWI